jgi:hypothetical protein
MNMGGDFDSAFRLDQIADKLLAMLGKGPDVVWAVERESLISRLVLAAEKQELRVRHPETLLPEVFNDWPQPSSFALVCTVADVNAWLESQGVPYRLDANTHAAQQEADQDTRPPIVAAQAAGLPTPQIAEAFSFVLGLKEKLGDVNNHRWLLPARLTKGNRPTPATWCPLKLADLLVSNGSTNEQPINAAFVSSQALRAWRDEWQEARRERNAFGR